MEFRLPESDYSDRGPADKWFFRLSAGTKIPAGTNSDHVQEIAENPMITDIHWIFSNLHCEEIRLNLYSFDPNFGIISFFPI